MYGSAAMAWTLTVTAILAAAPLLPRTIHTQPYIPPPAVIGLGTSCLDTGAPFRPDGTFEVVPGESEQVGEGHLVTYAVEVEGGLPVDPDCFARVVELTLGDRRGWLASGRYAFRRVSAEPGVIVTLASPATVDAHCLPLRTNGIFSCWNGSRAMLNYDRWERGVEHFPDLIEYRTYQINHEFGHGLGFGHVDCPRAGVPAPVMMQQTKGVGGCVPNGWPTVTELG